MEPGTRDRLGPGGRRQPAGGRRQRPAGRRPRGRLRARRRLGAARRGGDRAPGRSCPMAISFEQASTLPVAGLTALRSLERAVSSSASGCWSPAPAAGSGRFAIQLAKLAGAARDGSRPARRGIWPSSAPTRCAPELTTGGEDFDVVLDAIGGPVLGVVLQRVAPRGIGRQLRRHRARAGQLSHPGAVQPRPGRAALRPVHLQRARSHPVRRPPTCAGSRTWWRRAGWIPRSTLTAPWTEAPSAIEALLDRRVAGKAVLSVSS